MLLIIMLLKSRRSEASTTPQSNAPRTTQLQEQPMVHAAKRGNPWINLQDGREPQTAYQGSGKAMLSAESSSASPLAMASADFDEDGYQDLVVSYGTQGGGAIALYRTNPEALGPQTQETWKAIADSRFPSPFLFDASTIETTVTPDLVAVGDFHRDGHKDIMVAARGSNLMQLLRGDGHGGFHAEEPIILSGLLTAMVATDPNDDGIPDIVLAVNGNAPQLLVYHGMSDTAPVTYTLPASATALASGRFDGSGKPDLVAAAGNDLVIIQRADDARDRVEHVALSYNAVAVAVGYFVWDRENHLDIAVLGEDGTAHLLTPGELDRRPYTHDELKAIGQYRVRPGDTEGYEALRAFRQTLLRRSSSSDAWIEAETVNGTGAAGGASQIIAAKLSGAATDDLLVVDQSQRQVRAVLGVQARTLLDSAKNSVRTETADDLRPDAVTLDVEGSPLAVLPMKLNLGTRDGLVVLQQGRLNPTTLLAVPLSTFTVSKTTDTADGTCNADCSLREAIIASNNTAGPNAITLPANTYTLTLGPGDNEFNFAGRTPGSGDLDIINNDVTINGAGAATTIVQAGTTARTSNGSAGNATDGNGIDRIFDINNIDGFSGLYGPPINVTLSGITVRNGIAQKTSQGFNEAGGGIQFTAYDSSNAPNQKTLTLTNCIITANWSAAIGGGLFVQAGQVNFTGSTVSSNIAQFNTDGGGLDYDGVSDPTPNRGVSIANSSFTSNTVRGPNGTGGDGGGIATAATTAVSGGFGGVVITGTSHFDNNLAARHGGGIYMLNGIGFSMTGGTIQGNTASSSVAGTSTTGDGGGFFNHSVIVGTSTPGTSTLDGVTISSNASTLGNGGGIDNFFGTLTITTTSAATLIDSNTAGLNGGGVYNAWDTQSLDASATLNMTGGANALTVSNNTAKNNGGGIDDATTGATTFGTVSLTSLTISSNTANSDSSGGGDGGGLYIDAGSSGSIGTFSGNTFSSNVANSGTGDGIKLVSGTLTLANSGTNALNSGDSFAMTGGTLNTGNGTFTIDGNYNQSGGTFSDGTGTMNIHGNFTFSNTTFTANSGTIVFNGSSAQTITGGVTFFNLTINNGSGVTLQSSSSETVNGTLTLTNGALNVGANTLTLNSTVSFTSGTISSGTTGTVNYNQGSNGQNVAPGTYGNLTFSNFAKTLPNGQTVSISNVFTPGSGVPTITGSTVDFNGTGAQTIPAFNFNNLTISGARTGANSVTLANGGTIGVAGTFSPTATFGTGNYITTGNTFDFNGTGAQTVPAFNYNNLTISQARGANNVTLANGGTIGIAGTFNPSATFAGGAFVIANNTIDFNGTGAQSVAAFNYNNLTISQARGANSVTLANGGTIGIAGTFSPTATFAGGAFIVTNNTVNFNGAGSQSVPGFQYNNLTVSGSGRTITLDSSVTIKVAGTFTPGSNTFTITGSTFDFNGSAAQSLPVFNFNNLTISGARTLNTNVTLPNGTVGIAGTFSPTATFSGTGKFDVTSNTINFNGTGGQTVPAFSFNNLTLSNARSGANNITLVNGGTIKIAGTFTSSATFGTGGFILTGNTVEYNGTSAQTLDSSFPTYNNLTLNNAAGTSGFSGLTVNGLMEVKAGTFTSATTYTNVQIDNSATLAGNGSEIDVSGNWTNNGTFTANASLVKFNGSGAQSIGGSNSTTFADLTINNTGSTVSLGINTSVTGNLTVSSGTFDLGAFTANRSVAGGQISVSSGATLKIGGSNTFPANYNAHLLGATSTVDYNNSSSLSQTISAENYGNLSCNGNGARVLASSGTIGIFTAFTPGTHTYTVTGSTVEYNSTTNTQTLPSSGFNTYNNLNINNTGGGVTGFAGLIVNGLLDVKAGTFTSSTTLADVQIDSGATLAGTNATAMNVSGNWTNNGGSATSLTANGNTVNFNGSGSQTIGGNTSTTFSNLTINNATTPVALGIDTTVTGTLTLTRDLNASTFTLIQPSSAPISAGAGDVIGSVKRNNAGNPLPTGTTMSFGNQFNTLLFDPLSVLTPTDVTFTLAKTAPGTFPPPPPVTRTYTITQNNGGAFLATLELHYLDAELNGNNETNLKLWRFDGVSWVNMGALNHDPVNNWVRQTNIAAFSDWTLAADTTPTATNGDVSGRIVDGSGNPIEGAAIRLSGTENRLTVTDSKGNYRFDSVETNGFYTVTPSRANFTFSPAQRSFSQLGLHTDAAFSATASNNTLNPLDTSEYFVRQQYVDFLGREPDEAGLGFWVNNIESCGSDQNCRAAKRTDTSAAFFLSVEFQQTGYLVYRTYDAAYGNLASAPVPLRLREFKPDTQEISNGVVVNQSGWEQTLENNKQAFMNDFVQRARFVSAYPSTMSPADFVDQLFANAGVRPTAADRTAAIAEFGSAATTVDASARARALRRVAENADLAQKQFDSAFVLMQYFGYLQRDPNSSPDTNFDGYNFWLGKLDNFSGNFEQAEMVRAFVASSEYRGRFPR
jgi:CSLREA domain-containing protein